MDGISGIVAALAIILIGLTFFVAVALRRKRTIETQGYVKIEMVDQPIKELTKALFELAPTEIHRKVDSNGKSWLVVVDSGSSEDSGCMMLVYPVSQEGWPGVVLVRSGRRIPKIFRDFTGGIFKWAEPITDTEMNALEGTGWYAYQEPKKDVPLALKKRLCKAVKIPRSSGLLGIALMDSYLAVWSDAERLETILAIAPSVRAAILEPTQHA